MFNLDPGEFWTQQRIDAEIYTRALNHLCQCGHAYHRHEHGTPTFAEDIDESCRDCDCERYTS